MKRVFSESELSKLTPREREYFDIIYTQAGVLFLQGPPGHSKSIILKNIANKLNLLYIRLNLATKDETDLGVYPHPITENNRKFLIHLIPYWAERANKAENGALIVFEELNRCPVTLRNAALGILNERVIDDYELNENVFLAATGNLSNDVDIVDELGEAFESRLITVYHELSFEDWVQEYAKDNVHPAIIKYLSKYTEHFTSKMHTIKINKFEDTEIKKYLNPRTWTYFSEWLKYKKISENLDQPGEFEIVRKGGYHYIGKYINFFLNFFENKNQKQTDDINEVLKGKINISQLNEKNKFNLLSQVKTLDILNLSNKELNNLIKFLKSCEVDQRMGILHEMFWNNNLLLSEIKKSKNSKFYSSFKEELKSMIND